MYSNLYSSLKLQEYLIDCRRDLHSFPEVGCSLPKTKEYVTANLEELKIPFEIYDGAGIVAKIGQDRSKSKSFLLRADMDGLPIVEESGEPFSSLNGNMHACGHDLHTAILLGTAKVLKELEEQLKGNVFLVFQSGEENIKGMRRLIDSGLIKATNPGGAFALHVLPLRDMPPGTFSCQPGPVNSSVTVFEVQVLGKEAHGSTPYKGIDPIGISGQIISSISQLINYEIDLRENAVISFGYLNSASEEIYNVIPKEAKFGGGIRTFDDRISDYLVKRIDQICEGITSAYNTTYNFSVSSSVPANINDFELSKLVQEVAIANNMMRVALSPMPFSDDFSLLSKYVPACYAWLGAGFADDEMQHFLHHSSVRFNEETMIYGVDLMVNTALKWLEINIA